MLTEVEKPFAEESNGHQRTVDSLELALVHSHPIEYDLRYVVGGRNLDIKRVTRASAYRRRTSSSGKPTGTHHLGGHCALPLCLLW